MRYEGLPFGPVAGLERFSSSRRQRCLIDIFTDLVISSGDFLLLEKNKENKRGQRVHGVQ